MKRVGWLIEPMAEPENLREAFARARKGTRRTEERLAYEAGLSNNLQRLRSDLLQGELVFGPYRVFRVFDPKERVISVAAFSDRVAHHAMMRVCEPIFERYAIQDSFACRRGKGTSGCIARAREYCRRFAFWLKLDIRHYFETIPHEGLAGSLGRLFRDGRFLALAARLIASHQTAPGRGLPIGNLTSQHFANHYLGRLDHWVREGLRAPGYVRYMDDFVLWSDSRSQLRMWLRQLRLWVGEFLDLEIKETARIGASACGLPLLGFRIFSDRIFLTPRSRFRFRRKLRQYETLRQQGTWTDGQAARRVEALISFTRLANARNDRNRVIEELFS